MKTAKELLELRNELKRCDKEDIKNEWYNIEKIIDNFKITKEDEYIDIPKIKNDINKDKLEIYGFYIFEHISWSRLYFDKESYDQLISSLIHTK